MKFRIWGLKYAIYMRSAFLGAHVNEIIWYLSICMWAYFSYDNSLWVFPIFENDRISFFFLRLNTIPFSIYSTFSLPTHSVDIV
jgi:hypothetical protein